MFGDGTGFGIRIRYAVEESPLGTGGAVKNAEPFLDDRTVVLNGDVLADLDLATVVARHEAEKASATIVLTPVANPAAYGLVETDLEGRVLRFLEKPRPEQIRTNTINAGVYVLETRVLELMPPGVEVLDRAGLLPRPPRPRRPGPRAGARGLLDRHRHPREVPPGAPGHPRPGASRSTSTGRRPAAAGSTPRPVVSVDATLEGPFYVGPGCRVEAGAHVGPDAVLVSDVTVGPGARVRDSVIWRGATIGPEAEVGGSLLGPGVRIGTPRPGRTGRSWARAPSSATTRAAPPEPRRPTHDLDRPRHLQGLRHPRSLPRAASRRGGSAGGPRPRGLPRRGQDRRGSRLPPVVPGDRLGLHRGRPLPGVRRRGHRGGGHGHPVLLRCPPRARGRRHRDRLPQPEGVERPQARPPRRPRPLRRRRDQGDPRVGGSRPLRRRAAGHRGPRDRRHPGGLRAALPLLHRPRGDPSPQGRPRHRQRHGRGGGGGDLRAPAGGDRADVLRARRDLPQPPRRPPGRREPPRHRRARAFRGRGSRGSPGTATPTAASSSTTPGTTSPATS